MVCGGRLVFGRILLGLPLFGFRGRAGVRSAYIARLLLCELLELFGLLTFFFHWKKW